MSKPILLNAFQMNTVGHHAHGMWAHPRDRSRHYKELGYWLDLARTLERGGFDGIFFADVLGVYDVYQGSPDAALRNAMQIPVGDPMLLIPAMAAVTEHLGFGVTGMVGFEPPYPFARRMSTLDHLTNGRVAWNVVTGYLDSAARGMGLATQQTHDQRYEAADEYMEVVYRLWEGSWEDDAVVADARTHVFTDPAKVHRVRFDGAHYQVDAIHLCEPSPQRTPVLFQAGSSERGRAFAARHAECVFILQTSKSAAASLVADLRARAVAQGRAADDLRIFNLATVITGRDEADARAKLADYRRYVSAESVLAVLSGGSGIDFGKYALDEPLRYEKTEAVQSIEHMFQAGGTGKARTMRELAERGGIGSGSLLDRRIARAGGRRARGLGRRDRNRRLQPRLRGDARDVHGLRRPRRTGASASRARRSAPTRRERCATSCSATRACRTRTPRVHSGRHADECGGSREDESGSSRELRLPRLGYTDWR